MKKVLFILGELNDDDIDWLIQIGTRREIPAGTVLIQEGEQIDALYILLTGTFTVSVAALTGKEIARLSTGEVVGEMSFLDARLPSATVQAVESSLVLSIPRRALATKLQQDSGFASRFYRALAIFLSNRLRNIVGQADATKDQPFAEASTSNLESEPLETTELASTRFDWMLRRLING